jgi:hypothetical protein
MNRRTLPPTSTTTTKVPYPYYLPFHPPPLQLPHPRPRPPRRPKHIAALPALDQFFPFDTIRYGTIRYSRLTGTFHRPTQNPCSPRSNIDQETTSRPIHPHNPIVSTAQHNTAQNSTAQINRGVLRAGIEQTFASSSELAVSSSFTHWHCSDSRCSCTKTLPRPAPSETDAWAIFDQTQRPDTSIASPSIGPIRSSYSDSKPKA